ncbi:MAG TPA: hypothetical protein VHJ17_24310 [Thermomonospora sp.]|nr:hypothetical protein [Thermomonospora sp.]
MRLLALGLCAALTTSGCGVTRTISTGAYRVAVADGAVAELRALGFPVTDPPVCHVPATDSPTVVRITCTGGTVTGQPVRVDGVVTAADTSSPDERYVISVGGAEVLRKPCLGRGCAGPGGQSPDGYGNAQFHGKPARRQG